ASLVRCGSYSTYNRGAGGSLICLSGLRWGGFPIPAFLAGGQMKAHIVGGGFGGLAAAALLIRNADMPGPDITIYEADETLGGGFFLGGSAAGGYNLPGSVFDKEF